MDYIPYSCQSISDDDVVAVVETLRSPFLTQGPAVTKFEADFAAFHQVKHAIAVSNATAALHIACLALDVGPGKLVWTSPNSFLASANCALYCGADIDFVDIDPVTRNMSVKALAAKLAAAKAAGRVPNVVIPVDFSGLSCDLKEIRELADQYGFAILEDASHAVGATYHGRPVGSDHADLTVFSFHAVKIVTTGEGGIVTAQDDGLARRVQLLRSHGMTRETDEMQRAPDGSWYYEQKLLGYNYRMTDLQAALGSSQLKRIAAMQAERVARADRYDALLGDLPLKLPVRLNDRESAWHLYAIEVDPARTSVSRGELFEAMKAARIGVNVHYIPIHTQPHYERLGFKAGDYPQAEAYYAHAMSIPLFPKMTDEQQDRVVAVIRDTLNAKD